MKKALSILFFGLFIASFSIQSASARLNHVRSNLNTVNPSLGAQIRDVANTQAQAAAAAKIDYDEEYVKRFYTQSNLKDNYYKKDLKN